MFKVFAAMLIASLSLIGPADARSTVSDGIALIRNGQAEEARAVFAGLADAGEAEAMYHLGALHHSGLGGAEDLQQAIHWYARAADSGVPEAQMALGSLYYKGKGVRKDLAKALKLFSDAAEAGLLSAQFNLAMMHTAGLAHSTEYGANEDKPRAFKWFTIVLARIDDDDGRETAKDALDFLKNEMTADEMAYGETLAREWLEANPVDQNEGTAQ